MAFDLTTADKGRTEVLKTDGKWHPLLIDGTYEHDIEPGDGFIQIDGLGRKATGDAVLWLNFQRYPQKDSTAWVSIVLPKRAGAYAFHHDEHMTFKPGERYGVDYRIERGAPTIKLTNRVLKGDPLG